MTSKLEESYEQIPYPPISHFHTRLDRLSSIAHLYGLVSPPAPTSRVLELGCGPGTNLLALASRWPQGRFLGIDLSEGHIRFAKESATALGLGNLEFRKLSITDIGPDLGTFDYILAHGVFSWVPVDVRQKLLSVCEDHLSPEGLAYISYNTYPGWISKNWMREAMIFAAGGPEGTNRLQKAISFVDQLSQSPAIDGPTRAHLIQVSQDMREKDEAYLVHEFLEDTNQPFYFQEFIEMASACGLQYLADAEENVLVQEEWAPGRQLADEGEDLVRQEQRSDFLRQRTFRKSILCRKGRALDRPRALQRVLDMWIVSFLALDPSPIPGQAPGIVRFVRMDGKGALLVGPSLVKRMLEALQSKFPNGMSIRDLMQSLGFGQTPADEEAFGKQILQLWKQGYFDLTQEPIPVPVRHSERPCVHAVARFQALHASKFTNLVHGGVDITDGYRKLIPSIDGTRSVLELARVALDLGIIPSDPRTSAETQLGNAAAQVRSFLSWCLRHALLES